MSDPVTKLRVDKCWFARFYKTRGLATSKMVTGGHIRVNGTKIAKASHAIGPGDVLTLPQGHQIRVVRAGTGGAARTAPEAQTLYADLTEVKDDVPPAPRYEGKGRPTKRDRRMFDLGRAGELE
ncbi:MAG: S4 domain-containing protein [Thalassovita sp.]